MENIQATKFNLRLNGFQIKMFAITTMFIDHIGAFLLSYDSTFYIICRSIGRLAFPLFCWMIAEGAQHTRSMPKYIGRLAVFSLISTPPYNLVHGATWYSLDTLNVFFTLLFGLLAIGSIQNLAPWTFRKFGKPALADNKKACIFFGLPFCTALYIAAYVLNTDYRGYGVAAIVIFYLLRNHQTTAWISFALITFICYDFVFIYFTPEMNTSYVMIEMNPYDIIQKRIWEKNSSLYFYNARQMIAAFAFIPITLYNGQKGHGAKYLFYLFYPLHLILIWLIQLLIK